MLSRSEIVAALMRDFNMSRERAEQVAATQGAPPSSSSVTMPRREAITGRVPLRLTQPGALSFELPWSALVADNRRTQPVIRLIKGVPKAIVILTDPYKLAREKIREIAAAAMGDREPMAIPLALHGMVWVPDIRIHDTSNFGKGVHDALEGITYKTDHWLQKTTWEKIGVDVDRPRAEITIVPYAGRIGGSDAS